MNVQMHIYISIYKYKHLNIDIFGLLFKNDLSYDYHLPL